MYQRNLLKTTPLECTYLPKTPIERTYLTKTLGKCWKSMLKRGSMHTYLMMRKCAESPPNRVVWSVCSPWNLQHDTDLWSTIANGSFLQNVLVTTFKELLPSSVSVSNINALPWDELQEAETQKQSFIDEEKLGSWLPPCSHLHAPRWS